MKKLIAILTIVSFTFTAFASGDQALMQQGNEAYQKQNYEMAIDCYKTIVSHGNEGAVLFYNLGNAYFKNKQTAEALLWYERALRLDPSNEDIKHNIAFANLQITDKLEVLPELFIVRWWNGISESLSVTTWAILSIVFASIFAISIAVILVSKRRWISILALILAFLSLVIAIFSLIFAQHETKRYIQQPEAIVMQSVVNAKGTPDEAAASLFVIHSGLKVVVTDRVGQWVEIKLPNGEKGWIEASAMEVI